MYSLGISSTEDKKEDRTHTMVCGSDYEISKAWGAFLADNKLRGRTHWEFILKGRDGKTAPIDDTFRIKERAVAFCESWRASNE